jgi:cell division protein FtsB
MEKPSYAGIQSIVNSGDRIHQSILELEASLRKAFDDRVGLIERKLATVTQENNTLHHERVILAKEIQKLRAERKAILGLLGVREAGK